MLSKDELMGWLYNGEGQSRSPYEASEHFKIPIEDVYRIIRGG